MQLRLEKVMGISYMKFSNYVKDKWYTILLYFFFMFLFLLLFFAFKLKMQLIVIFLTLYFLFFSLLLLIDFFRKKTFYQKLLFQIKELDQSYLITELLEEPNFYEGKLFYQALYEINKSMIENIKNYEYQTNDFKEYIEMWIHEVKIPISSLVLMAHNHKEKFPVKATEQMKRIEDYVEQILYYVRSENAHKDYLINEVSLEKVIASVALRNKDDLLENHIDFIVSCHGETVLTDSKWLEFICNQIINNSIKYKDEKKESYIKITVKKEKQNTILEIEDNGIGIPKTDIKRVFDKSFTGYNGRIKKHSTGMGLFIAKKLCKKLGSKIEIESIQNVYAKVSIFFYENTYYDVLK